MVNQKLKAAILHVLAESPARRLPRRVLWEKIPDFDEYSWQEYYDAEAELINERLIYVRRGPNGGVILVDKAPDQQGSGADTIGQVRQAIVRALEPAPDGRLPRELIWTTIPNFAQISWNDYYQAEDELISEGEIEVRRGRNGGVFLVPKESAEPTPDPVERAEEEEADREHDLYEGAVALIAANWAQRFKLQAVIPALTAYGGAKKTKGRWSRPDVTICTVAKWLFSVSPVAEVTTIEIKLFEAAGVDSVYEAVSHQRRAHYAYVLLAGVPEQLSAAEQQRFDRIAKVASRHGIGLISSTSTSNWSTWDFLIDPVLSDAGDFYVNEFLVEQFPPKKQRELAIALDRATLA